MIWALLVVAMFLGRPSSVYGTNLCEPNMGDKPKCVPEFSLQQEDSVADKTEALLSGPFQDLSVLNYSAVFVFDDFFVTSEFQTQSQYNAYVFSSFTRNVLLFPVSHFEYLSATITFLFQKTLSVTDIV